MSIFRNLMICGNPKNNLKLDRILQSFGERLQNKLTAIKLKAGKSEIKHSKKELKKLLERLSAGMVEALR